MEILQKHVNSMEKDSLTERQPDKGIPEERTFTRLHARLCDTGSLTNWSERPGEPRAIMTPQSP